MNREWVQRHDGSGYWISTSSSNGAMTGSDSGEGVPKDGESPQASSPPIPSPRSCRALARALDAWGRVQLWVEGTRVA